MTERKAGYRTRPAVSFTAYGQPLPKQSFKYTRRGGGYTPAAVKAWQQSVKLAAMKVRPDAPLTGRVRVILRFYRADAHRVDADNLSKAVLDACNGVLWDDDQQVTDLYIMKRSSADCPRVEVYVREMEPR